MAVVGIASGIPYSWKYWWELSLVVGPHVTITNIGGFKFGRLVRDHHTYIYIYASMKYILVDFNLVVAR